MAIRLILVSKAGPSRDAYIIQAKAIGIALDIVDTFPDLVKFMITQSYQGVLIDLITSIKASPEEKAVVQSILDVFPVVHLKWDPQTGSIHALSDTSAQNDTLEHFIASACKPFSPRAIRLDVRKNIHFNILFSTTPEMTPEKTQRSITVNISKKGCFLFSCQDWSNVTNVWMVGNELDDKTPIACEIRWRQLWGKSLAIPGIGLKVMEITDGQKTQLTQQFSI